LEYAVTRRASLLIRLAGVIAIFGGVHYAVATWMEARGGFAGARFFDLASSPAGTAFAGDLAGALRADLTLPRLLLTDPLIWLGVGLVLTPSVYRRLTRCAAADDPSYAGYAYVECPECRHVVPMSAKRCPLCGAELLAPWANASRHA